LDGESAKQVRPNVIASEERLEKIIQERLDILGLDDLFQIGRQVITDFGKRIDLLAIDERGDLYVIELKRDRTPREVVAQAQEYGFWAQGLSLEAVRELYAKHHQGDDFDSAFTSYFEGDLPESINTDHHLVVVAGGIDTSSEQIVEYLRAYRVPINVLFFEYLQVSVATCSGPGFDVWSGPTSRLLFVLVMLPDVGRCCGAGARRAEA
jgi:hypothetical protein